MEHHIGTDIIEISRIRQTIERWGDRFLNRVYTKSEQVMYDRRPHSLAACFAGKEAVVKTLEARTKGIGWKEIEILADSTGKPLVHLYGKAKNQANSLGIDRLAISLSHSREYAIALIIGETK